LRKIRVVGDEGIAELESEHEYDKCDDKFREEQSLIDYFGYSRGSNG
jgi:hypothetical protein